ncbi:hypothetical protein MKK62_16905 [Mycobacterium paraterrae]|uniref:Uncharacterized protein n=1 Tax=Mycobacterium paraterrae TaxID=577492 RepID=A0ABY3VFD1_9MYCO|nr:hypothetical protein MKK62_16905 [Mycobacterium paraterrae]
MVDLLAEWAVDPALDAGMQRIVDVLLEKRCRRNRFGGAECLLDGLVADLGGCRAGDEVAEQVAEAEVVGVCRRRGQQCRRRECGTETRSEDHVRPRSLTPV